jgi:hypothetical protein
MELRRIPFTELVDYWRRTDHFKDPNKVYTEIVPNLGPYQCSLKDPRRISYGLFLGGRLIGATHITAWNEAWIRCRTINVLPEFRGENLGVRLLNSALWMDWRDCRRMLGWIRDTAVPWAVKYGFREIDGRWHGHHMAMLKSIDTEDLEQRLMDYSDAPAQP